MLALALVLLTPLPQASSEVAAPRESISRPSSGECSVVGLRPAPAVPRPAREAGGPEALVPPRPRRGPPPASSGAALPSGGFRSVNGTA